MGRSWMAVAASVILVAGGCGPSHVRTSAAATPIPDSPTPPSPQSVATTPVSGGLPLHVPVDGSYAYTFGKATVTDTFVTTDSSATSIGFVMKERSSDALNYSDDQALVLSSTDLEVTSEAYFTRLGGVLDACDYKPPRQVLPNPLVVGKLWTNASTCTTTLRTVVITEKAEVQSKSVMTLAGATGEIFVVHRTLENTVTATGQKPIVETRDQTDYVSPAYGLILRSVIAYGDGTHGELLLTSVQPA